MDYIVPAEFGALGMTRRRATLPLFVTFVRRHCGSELFSNHEHTRKYYMCGRSPNWRAILGGPMLAASDMPDTVRAMVIRADQQFDLTLPFDKKYGFKIRDQIKFRRKAGKTMWLGVCCHQYSQ